MDGTKHVPNEKKKDYLYYRLAISLKTSQRTFAPEKYYEKNVHYQNLTLWFSISNRCVNICDIQYRYFIFIYPFTNAENTDQMDGWMVRKKTSLHIQMDQMESIIYVAKDNQEFAILFLYISFRKRIGHLN